MKTRRPEGSIRRRADGRYEVRVQTGINYNTGAPIRKSVYAHTEEEAQRLLYGLLADPGQAIKHVGDNCTLNEWLECWLRTYVADHVKQSTFTSYRTYVQKHFAPVLALSDVKSENPRRSIPLLRGICADLEAWHNVQQRDIERIGADVFAHPEI